MQESMAFISQRFQNYKELSFLHYISSLGKLTIPNLNPVGMYTFPVYNPVIIDNIFQKNASQVSLSMLQMVSTGMGAE